MIYYHLDKDVDYSQLINLFEQVGWNDKTQELGRLQDMVEQSQMIVTAWDEGMMIGFARCSTDHAFNGQINNVVVDQNYRGRGIGKTMLAHILNANEKITFILRGDEENIGFYKSLGFEDSPLTLIYKRKK